MEINHNTMFTEFCRLELSTGGPDPQVEIIAQAGQGEQEKGWLAGCFIGPYTVGAAAALNAGTTRAKVLQDPAGLTTWIGRNWAGLPIRRERRAVWKIEKLSECLHSYAVWSEYTLPGLIYASFDTVWDSLDKEVRYVGRYASMKLIEVLYRQNLLQNARQDSIVPDGAWSPRKTLGLLHPEDVAEFPGLLTGNSVATLQRVNEVANTRRLTLNKDLNTTVSFFDYETMLCNYRQALKGKYPGRSHDRELAYYIKAFSVSSQRDDSFPFAKIRRERFNNHCLGELNGWGGARKELETIFDDHGYFWCDTVFDYKNTADFANPVRW
jgi:hypothetical protein